MSVPKKKIDVTPNNIGKIRQDELIDLTNEKSTNLPQSILLEDLDLAMFDYFESTKLPLVVEGKHVPVFWMTSERWADFSTTWKYSDEEGNIILPFITVRRSEPPKAGTNQNIKYRVAQNKKFTYYKVPTFDNGVHGMDIYKIPQPTPIDITYEIRLFTHYILDMNAFNEMIHTEFGSRQSYVNIKGYFIPLTLESISDESTLNDFEGQRFYSQTFTFLMQGFLQNTDYMEVQKGLRRVVVNINEKSDNQDFDKI